MMLFVYGTLLDPATLAARAGDPSLRETGRPAVLRGWRRVAKAGTPWPTLQRRPSDTVAGKVVVVGAASLRRLAAYEGPAYRLHRVVVETPSGHERAWTWIAPGGSHRPWTQQRSSHDQL
jgi:gamma-glutamylcyclotransferase (GGCT)/AIG2-like uncharacterized protein YtfP